MYNLLLSLGMAVLAALAILLAGFSAWAAIFPALLVFVAANIFLGRRISKKVQALLGSVQRELQARKVERAVKVLEEALKFEKWQLFLGPEIHSNIGLLLYINKDFEAARSHLEGSGQRGPTSARAKAMLGCLHFNAKKSAEMRAAFEGAVKAGKKEGIVWATYAYCLEKLGEREGALRVLARAVQTNPTDEKLKALQVALQNDKRLKMKLYEPEWYQFHLERPPPEFGGPSGGRRVIYQRR